MEHKDPVCASCTTWCVHSRGGAEAAATAGAERAADAAEAKLLDNLPEKLDEFGRDENVELREEMSRRARKWTAQYSTPPAQAQVCLTNESITVDAYCACQLRPSKIARHCDSDHGGYHCLCILLSNSTWVQQHSRLPAFEHRPNTPQSQRQTSLLYSVFQSAIVIVHCLLS